MYKGHQNEWLFLICGTLAIMLILFLSASMFIIGMQDGFTRDMIIMIVISLLGCIGMAFGILWGFRTFCNMNFGKKDTSVMITYKMLIHDQILSLTDIDDLREALLNLSDNETIFVSLTPDYFGLTAWTFTKCKGSYLSFVHIHKKKGLVQYYIYPCRDIDYALSEFVKVFVEKRAVDTTALLDMKHYRAVLEVCHLNHEKHLLSFTTLKL